MNIPESATPDPSSSQKDVIHLHEAVERVHKQLQAGFAAVILIALGVNLFLYTQQSMAQQQLLELGQVMRAENEYLSKSVPQMHELLEKFREYAKTHPDFRPVVEKHFPSAISPAPVPVPLSTNKGKP